MSKRWIVFIALAVSLLSVLVVFGSVLAQRSDTPGSTQPPSSADGPVTPAAPRMAEREPAATTYNSSLRFVGSTLRPRRNDVNYTTNSNGSCVYVTGGEPSTVWNLPLALPDGAQVERLRMYYYDTSASQTTYGWFSKYDLYGGLVQEWGVTSLYSSGNSYDDVVISPTETIDYSAYSYVLNWRPGYVITSTVQLCGFRLFYTAPVGGVYLPVIVRQ